MDVYGRKNGWTDERTSACGSRSAGRLDDKRSLGNVAARTGERIYIPTRCDATQHAATCVRLGSATLAADATHVTHKRILFGPISHLPRGLPLAEAQWKDNPGEKEIY